MKTRVYIVQLSIFKLSSEQPHKSTKNTKFFHFFNAKISQKTLNCIKNQTKKITHPKKVLSTFGVHFLRSSHTCMARFLSFFVFLYIAFVLLYTLCSRLSRKMRLSAQSNNRSIFFILALPQHLVLQKLSQTIDHRTRRG